MMKTDCQAGFILDDRTGSGRVIDWEGHKVRNEHLALAYDGVDTHKAARLRGCASYLGYRIENGRKRLANANFCRVRLCPVCQWRRSLKTYSQMRDILGAVERKEHYSYIFMTLTVKNVRLDDLSQTLDKLMNGWNRLTKYKALRPVKGWYRGVEITHDTDQLITPQRYKRAKSHYDLLGLKPGDINPGYDTYHPHIHALLAVGSSYFSGRDYISQEKLVELWGRACKLDYGPVVNIKRVRYKPGMVDDTGAITPLLAAVAECTKYAVKDTDVVVMDDWDLTVDTVRGLDQILASRRFVAMGGVFSDAHKALHLDDPDEGDLVHLNGDDSGDNDADAEIFTYVWCTGYNQYILAAD